MRPEADEGQVAAWVDYNEIADLPAFIEGLWIMIVNIMIVIMSFS